MEEEEDSDQNLDLSPCWLCQQGSLKEAFAHTVDLKIFARILFSRIAFKTHIFNIKICEKGMINLYQ